MPCKINNSSDFDISEIEDLIQDLFSFSQNRLGFQDSPVLNLVSDEKNTSPLGKTANYDPNSMEITIYVDGRHPKDIMRSFSHELVHHNQNLKGEFANIVGQGGSNYAQTNPHLRKMEKEAYLKGNMCFRDWEDGYKSSNPNILNERRIYKMSVKDWKNKELNTLLNEKWGFSMNLGKLNENKKKKGKYDDGDNKDEKCDYVDCGDKEEVNEISMGHGTDGKGKEVNLKQAKNNLKNVGNPPKKDKKKETKTMKEAEGDKKMGDNPEGVTELMAAINKLSDEESDQIYSMLRKKHASKNKNPKEAKLREAVRKIIKKKLIEQEQTPSDQDEKLTTTSGGRYSTKDPEMVAKVQQLAQGIIKNPSITKSAAGIETIIQKMIATLGSSDKTLSQTKTDMAKVKDQNK